jgi:hypothetical protein
MKTAHFNSHTKLILAVSLVVVTALFFNLSKDVLAQAVTNPFAPSDDTRPANLITTPISDPTDATKTIAQDQITLTAIPPRMGEDNSLKVKPGEKLQVQVRVRNISEQPISVVTSAQDFIVSEDGETPIGVDDNVSNRWSLASWLTITPTQHFIPSGQTVGVTVLIEVPEDALPGGHYAMILHEPGNGQDTNAETVAEIDSSAAINQRVGTLLYVLVDGPINEEAYVRDFAFPQFSEYGPVPYSFVVENNSDVHITPQMSIEIFNIFNKKVETIKVDSKNVFPLTSRSFEGQWERIWGWGLYNATLTMSYGSMGSIVVAHTSFWLLPIKVIIAVITLIFAIIFMIMAVKKHLKHRQAMDEKRIEELESKIQNMESHNDVGPENNRE